MSHMKLFRSHLTSASKQQQQQHSDASITITQQQICINLINTICLCASNSPPDQQPYDDIYLHCARIAVASAKSVVWTAECQDTLLTTTPFKWLHTHGVLHAQELGVEWMVLIYSTPQRVCAWGCVHVIVKALAVVLQSTKLP
jgi:hypothetical protein